jgi:hypothetical protein
LRRLLAAALLLVPSAAWAHGAGQGFVLLLPTGHYAAGGALAVAASFLVVAFVPAEAARRIAAARLVLGRIRPPDPAWISTLSFLFLLAVVGAGFRGNPDPMTNPMPLLVWTVWWVALVLLHAVLGDLWAYLNPFTGPYRLIDRALGGRLSAMTRPPPEGLAARSAILVFFAFAWFELVDLAPNDPPRLAALVAVYLVLTFALLLTFGEAWLERGDPFAIFFRFVAGLSPLLLEPEPDGRRRVALGWPGAALAARPPLPLGLVFFVLLTLATVSFDGLSRTFAWLALGGINPLEFPGRSAVVAMNSAGLALTFLVLAAGFCGAVALGRRLGRIETPLPRLLGRSVLSLVPISIAFHFAHYLTALMADGQYAALVANDPLHRGWDLLGLQGYYVTTSFLSTHDGTIAIWTLQTGAIVLGHVLAVVIAHLIAVTDTQDRRRAVLSELPLAAVMVFYTLFGFWLLSTPVVG